MNTPEEPVNPRPPHPNGVDRQHPLGGRPEGDTGATPRDSQPGGVEAGLPVGGWGERHPDRAEGAPASSANRSSGQTAQLQASPARGRAGESVLIGEIVESSSIDFLAQACELDAAPPFGAFVEVVSDDALSVYGVVAQVQTAGIDPGSRAIMRGHGDVRDERIYAENPDLPLVLRTTFKALVVGFAEGPRLFQFLPPRPPRLHYSVFVCSPQTVRTFANAGLDYLVPMLNAPDAPVDELLAANLRYTSRCFGDSGEFLQLAGRELAHLLRADYARLTAVLRRCLAPSEVA